jgi:hypothetical protein
MRSLFTLVLLYGCAGLLSVHAQQQSVNDNGAKDPKAVVQKEVRKTLSGADTTVRGQSGQVTKEIGQKITDQTDQVKQQTSGQAVKEKVRETARETVKTTAPQQVKTIGKDAKNDAAAVKNEVTGTKGRVTTEAKNIASQGKEVKSVDKEKLLEDNATKLQYDSENPDNAPWKQDPLSNKDLKDQKLPVSLPGNVSSLESKPEEYAGKIKDIDAGSISGKGIGDKIPASPDKGDTRLGSIANILDSVSAMKDKADLENLKQTLTGSKKVYSDKFIKKMYDSLGIEKGDSLFKAASAFIKTETPKEDLLAKINGTVSEKDLNGIGYDPEKQSLRIADADKLNALPDQAQKPDLSKLRLPDSVLSELTPLHGRLMNSKYMSAIDSMRDVALKAKKQSLDEEQVTDELKRSVMKKKPRFFDKTYFEGIIGFVSDSSINVVQLSPSLGYHFTDFLSVGLGPNLQLQIDDRKVNALAGMRSFIKAEVWKQRLYLQVEDNVSDTKVGKEPVRIAGHSVMTGGGGLLPFSRSLALNLSVLYKVYQDTPQGSPWVFRVGISSIKKTKP